MGNIKISKDKSNEKNSHFNICLLATSGISF